MEVIVMSICRTKYTAICKVVDTSDYITISYSPDEEINIFDRRTV